MDLDLGGKIAVVTGASKGIGLAVMRALVAEGVDVTAGARTVGALRGLDGVTAVAVDLAAPDGPAASSRARSSELGRVDVLVNNVGARPAPPRGLPRHQRRGVRVGDADELLHRPAGDPCRTRGMVERGAGRSSTSPRSTPSSSPTPATIDYGAAKAALVNLAKSLSQEFGPKGIRVNSVPRARSHRPLARRAWRRRDGRRGHRRRRRHGPRAGRRRDRRLRHRPLHHARGSRHARRVPRLGAHANVTGANYVIDGGLIKTL